MVSDTSKSPIIYVTRDPERATGAEQLIENYHIVCPFKSKLTDDLKKSGIPVFVLEEECKNAVWKDSLKTGTYGILKLDCVKEYIQKVSEGNKPRILVLKTSELIEQLCQENEWELWAPKAAIADLFEHKISQYEELKQFVPFPKTQTGTLRDLAASIKTGQFPMVLQFNIGHSGEGTVLLSSAKDIERYSSAFPKREARVMPYIEGDCFTLNALVTKQGNTYTGSISLQLTGLKEATGNPLTTVGNDFEKARELLTGEQATEIASIAQRIGMVMHSKGYRGLFGIDVIRDKKGELFFIEVNTHQPASIPFEAKLHLHIGAIPLFLLWIRDMMDNDGFIPAEELLPPILLPFPAYQMIYRNKEAHDIEADTVSYPPLPHVIPSRLRNIKPNEELFRIQVYEQPQPKENSDSGDSHSHD